MGGGIGKRNFTRVTFDSEATVHYGDLTIRGKIDNLSLQGMLLRTSEKVPLNEEVEIKVSLSGASSELVVSLTGKAIRGTEDFLAFKFDGMDLDSFIHLKNIIAYNMGNEREVMEEFFKYMERDRSE